MKPIAGYDLVNEAGGFKQLPAGIYGVVITNVINVPEKEYLEVYCDIVKGEYAGYFKALVESGLKDSSKSCRSYKQNALAFFKGFITAIEKTNPPYKWDWDESKLIGKNVIAVFGEEEYIDSEGNIKTLIKVIEFRSLEAYQNNLIKIPEKKKISEEELAQWKLMHKPVVNEEKTTVDNASINLDDLPF